MPRRILSHSLISWLFLFLATCGVIPGEEARSRSHEHQARAAGRVQEPLDGVEALIRAGKHSEAQSALRQAHQIYRSKGDRHGEAICQLLLGIGELRAANLATATADLTRAGALFTALGDRFGGWIAEWMLGSLKAGAGQFEVAIVHFERALEILRQASDPRDPFSLRALHYAHSSLLLPDDVVRLLRSGHRSVSPELLHFLEAMSRDGHLWILVLSGRLADAEAELSRLTEFSRRLGGRFDSLVEVHRGELRRKQGRLGEARESFRKALEGASSLPPAPFRDEWPDLQILEHLVEIELLNGRCGAALTWSDKALERLRIRGAKNGRFSVLVRIHRAGVHAKCGRLSEAEATLVEALGTARQGRSVYLQATTATQLGRLLAEPARRFEEAALYLETAVGLFQSLDAPLDEVKAWLLLSECYTNLEAHDLASAALERARGLVAKRGIPRVAEIVEKVAGLQRLRRDLAAGKNLERLLEVLNELRMSTAEEGFEASFLGPFLEGYLHFKRGRIASARDLWTTALKGAPTRELEAYLQAAIGVSYWAEGKIDRALPYFDQAVDAFESALDDVRVGELLTMFLGGPRQGFFRSLVEMLVLKGRPTEAFDYAERARARAFLQSLGNHRLRPHRGPDARLVNDAEDLRTRILGLEDQVRSAAPSEKARLSADLQKARQEYELLFVRLKVHSGEYAALTRVEPLDVREVQKELPEKSTLVSFFVSSDRVHAWVMDREAFHYVALPFGPEDRRRAVCWADEVGHLVRGTRPFVSRCGSAAADPEAIYEKVIAPLASKIRHANLILIPHGELHYWPFAALRNPRTGRFLIEDYTLSYVPSASTLRFLHAKDTPVQGQSLVLGAPERRDPELSPWRGMEGEAVAVARLLRTQPLLGPQATENRLYGVNGDVDLLHIAAHGIYDPDAPLFSRIALAQEKPIDGKHDGNLEVHEILADLDLSGVNLVVLSACETALGERSEGDEITSLTRAVLYAGSPTVVSTLWKIDDTASAVLMEEFYRRLLGGDSAAEALRKAQLSLLREPRYRRPYYWAAFGLSGNAQMRWRKRPDDS